MSVSANIVQDHYVNLKLISKLKNLYTIISYKIKMFVFTRLVIHRWPSLFITIFSYYYEHLSSMPIRLALML